MIKKVGVAILGLGVVGGGTYKTLVEHREYYKKTQGVDVSVESVLVRTKQKALDLGVDPAIIANSIAEVIANPAVDIVIETIGGCEAAKEYILAALKEGKSVVTANKELICKHWHELERTAKRNGCGLYFEASCVGGVPIIRTLLDGVQSNYVQEMLGIINGTTNYILTRMSKDGASYETVLKDAQSLGYAEADPTNDVEGFDAVYKLSILSSLAFHQKISYEHIFREGISKIDTKDIEFGKDMGYTLKLLAIAKNSEKGVELRVHPTFIRNSHPLTGVNDAFNAVYLKGDAVDNIMLYGRGAGSLPTASAVVSDVLYAATHSEIKYATFNNSVEGAEKVKYVSDFQSVYYVRLSVEDEVGSLARICGIFANNGVSIVEVGQKGHYLGDGEKPRVPVYLITNKTFESKINSAVKAINESNVATVEALIRIEE
ncbi:MAG: homoserine dehydrogenase [Clostridia bacterium]|nr:homoserine dehydrogenase [Clostridia bacterium]